MMRGGLRPGAGRKRDADAPRNVPLQIRLTATEMARLKRVASDGHSTWARKVIMRAVERRERANLPTRR